VHIADASYFVEEGGAIDARASETTTSIYLVHRVLNMLPRVLCDTMCSLNPGKERLTLSIWFKLTE
jgi:exoribonuclease R